MNGVNDGIAVGSPEARERLGGSTDTALLKLLALLFMLTDHIGAVVYPGIRELRVLGRIAMPLYAWCLVVGNVKTRRPLRYFARLLGLAVLSQPLYMMALRHQWAELNILFLLALATAAIQGVRKRFYGSEIWAPALCYLLLGFLKIDYGWRGLTFILLLYFARETPGGLAAAFLAYALFWGASGSAINSLFGVPLSFLEIPGIGDALNGFFRMQSMMWLALPLILRPTASGLKTPRWLGYALYPLHLVLLIALRMLLGGATWAAIVSCF